MDITKQQLRFITHAIEAIDEKNALIEMYLGNYCSECDENLDEYAMESRENHVLYNDIVLIGCEGYYMINPNMLGIYSPNWSFWKDDAIS